MSAYFSATETAFSSLNKTRLKVLADNGNKRAALALKLAENYVDCFRRHAAVQRGCDPAALVHVVRRKNAGFAAQRCNQDRIALEIDDIEFLRSCKSQLVPRHFHDQRKPLPVARMTEYGGARRVRPRIIRFCAVVIPDVCF